MAGPEGSPRALGWWAIDGETFLEALYRAHAGEDPDLIYAELYANSEHRHEWPRAEGDAAEG